MFKINTDQRKEPQNHKEKVPAPVDAAKSDKVDDIEIQFSITRNLSVCIEESDDVKVLPSNVNHSSN